MMMLVHLTSLPSGAESSGFIARGSEEELRRRAKREAEQFREDPTSRAAVHLFLLRDRAAEDRWSSEATLFPGAVLRCLEREGLAELVGQVLAEA